MLVAFFFLKKKKPILIISLIQILEAVARKMTVSPEVDFDEIAAKTEGFSGADLQALVYNAHLDVIHSSIVDTPSTDSNSRQSEEMPIQYITIGGPNDKSVLSKAEEMALQRRVSPNLLRSPYMIHPLHCYSSVKSCRSHPQNSLLRTKPKFLRRGR